MSLMSGLYVGLSGIQTSSNSLNTTANNLTNVNTEGFVRQQVIHKDVGYNFVSTTSATTTGQGGRGVTVATINHVRDIFLDAAYRKEAGRQMFYEKMYESVYEIQVHMGDEDGIEGIAFQNSITNLLESLNEVAKAPGYQVARASLVQRAVEFVDKSQTIYNGLKDYQQTQNDEVISMVNRINEIGESIMDLNRRVAKIEAGGVETAVDLRDERDLLLDELSKYCKISYKETAQGVVEVSVEGVPFADELSVNHMGLKEVNGCNLVIPVWSGMGDQNVYNMNLTISTEDNTDIGGLKGLLAARGNVIPTVASMTAPDPELYGGEGTTAYEQAMDEYNRYVDSSKTSTLVNVMANFDKLVTSVIESINDILCPETTAVVGGKTVTVLDTDKASTAADGTYGIELFTRNYCDRYTEAVDDDGNTVYIRNDLNSFGNVAIYSISNIYVNNDILKDYSKIPLTCADGSDDYAKAQEMVDVFSKDILKYNDGLDYLTFQEFYETMTGDFANAGKIYESMATNETTLANSLDDERQQVMGVSSDEELGSMIKFQQAYNAASRYINVVSEMIDTLINRTGG